LPTQVLRTYAIDAKAKGSKNTRGLKLIFHVNIIFYLSKGTSRLVKYMTRNFSSNMLDPQFLVIDQPKIMKGSICTIESSPLYLVHRLDKSRCLLVGKHRFDECKVSSRPGYVLSVDSFLIANQE
jgi:hypothetical protein